jgi:hypothetical protein
MGRSYLSGDRADSPLRGWWGLGVHVKPWGAPPAPSGVTPQVAGEPAPGCSLSDVPMSHNNQGRFARITNERGAVLPLMVLMLVVLLGAANRASTVGHYVPRRREGPPPGSTAKGI